MTVLSSDFDSPWKEMLERYFQNFMEFFFPKAASDIDWSQGYEFLDKELQQVTREAELGRRYVDKLVKVFRRYGKEAWVLVHIEVQSQPERGFEERMYIYNNRIYDKYRRQVVSLAILADESRSWRPRSFEYSLWGCRILLEYPIAKLHDYSELVDVLSESRDVFAVVTVAHIRTLDSRNDVQRRLQLKLEIVKALYRKGYDRRHIIDLFRFIDWVMRLPEDLDRNFWDTMATFEEKTEMRYITSVERIGMKKGLQQGLEKGLQEGRQKGLQEGTQQTLQANIVEILSVRFPMVPQEISDAVRQIERVERLHLLFRGAAMVPTLDAFVELLAQE